MSDRKLVFLMLFSFLFNALMNALPVFRNALLSHHAYLPRPQRRLAVFLRVFFKLIMLKIMLKMSSKKYMLEEVMGLKNGERGVA